MLNMNLFENEHKFKEAKTELEVKKKEIETKKKEIEELEKTIRHLSQWTLNDSKVRFGYEQGKKDAENTIKKLLELSKAKCPVLEGDGYFDGELVYDTWYCPNCDSDFEVDYQKYNYCPNCGQHINWKFLKTEEDEIN